MTIAALVTLAALAPVPAGELTKPEARAFIVRNLPASAPAELLQDKRARFYSTHHLRVQRARRCTRLARPLVSCRFRLWLEPDAEHGEAGWWPIRCRGVERVASLSDGGTGGLVYDYRCRTVRRLP